tara:strand:- start:372 stop:515 length:144 start_codon:yes stop_codon:yes gene_type:complete
MILAAATTSNASFSKSPKGGALLIGNPASFNTSQKKILIITGSKVAK